MPPEAKVPPLKVDQRGASLVQGQERDMINRTYPHGVPCWIDTEQPDVEAATAFYGGIFGWTFEDAMPPGGPGRYLIARLAGKDVCAIGGPGEDVATWRTYIAVDDADIRARQSGVLVPPGFEDAIAWVAPTGADESPSWHVSFTVADRDQTVAKAERLGAQLLRQEDTKWTRSALIGDPQGAEFTASQFPPPSGWGCRG